MNASRSEAFMESKDLYRWNQPEQSAEIALFPQKNSLARV
jgi:hypothetical protein